MLDLGSLPDYLLCLMWPSPGVCSLYGRATGFTIRVKVTSSKRTYANTLCLPGLLLPVPLTPQQATVNPLLCSRSPNTQANLAQSLVGPLLLSPGSWCTQYFFCALQESLFPPVQRKFYTQILLTFKNRFPGHSQSLCWNSRLGSLM